LLYIVVALKPEAQAFVDKYKLKKSKLSNFTIFSSNDIILIISGLGVHNARSATQALINHKDITDDDIYLNVGICAAEQKHKIGSLLSVGSIFYEEEEYTFNEQNLQILCSDTPIDKEISSPVDMESFGFYDAVIHNPAIKNFFILKVVSDHFEPEKVTKEATKVLIFKQLEAITTILEKKEAN
jgi:nucleoside phosphorylase